MDKDFFELNVTFSCSFWNLFFHVKLSKQSDKLKNQIVTFSSSALHYFENNHDIFRDMSLADYSVLCCKFKKKSFD